MKNSSEHEWALGLYEYPSAAPSPQTFESFYGIVCGFLADLSVAPSHIAAEGGEHSGRLEIFGGASAKRIVESKFVNVSGLSIVVSPKHSKEPAFDRLVSANLTWTAPSELLVCIVANEATAQFLGARFCSVIQNLLEWKTWTFGFGFKDTVARQPDFHVLAIDNGRLATHEKEALIRWYRAKCEDRQARLRDVYPVNILNPKQTERMIGNQTLGATIRAMPGSTVEEINGVTLWKLPDTGLAVGRAQLAAHGALISVAPADPQHK